MVVAAVMAVRINPKMSATLLIMLPIIIVIVALIMKFGFPMFQKMQKKVDNVNRVVQENLIGMRVVKAFVVRSMKRINSIILRMNLQSKVLWHQALL